MGRRNKRDSAMNEIASNHLYGSRFARNPANNRLALIERMYMRVLTELATNRFKWEGMPDSIDVRFLELTLFNRALSVFFKDERYGKFLALAGGGTNMVNMVDNPTGFLVTGANYPSRTVSAKHAVPIWANYVRMPDWDIVMLYSSRLAEIDRTIEINTKSARRTKILVTSENSRLSVENINRQIDEGQPTIRVAMPLQDMAFIQAVDLGVDPDSITNLHILRTRQWNECMGLLGIENANQDKKERLVAAEVEANDDQTSMMRYVNLNARRSAAEAINKMFGLDVSVSYYTDEERKSMGLNTSLPELGGAM